ncbi:hypothetical protein L211DRAFT_699333 [Terfezia boudieri ATCC MYA-4762]|uniref:Uncharacterized protein n=1 Tax=Terfezia boudieri ATCC MYA-4762 TaxID=1051890 RepID=A0A3N4LTF0_9PEZI|nr:hypothetical protein L211DRAFT_699333 [Terfezia boudieri ATCC MYA-4762]
MSATEGYNSRGPVPRPRVHQHDISSGRLPAPGNNFFTNTPIPSHNRYPSYRFKSYKKGRLYPQQPRDLQLLSFRSQFHNLHYNSIDIRLEVLQSTSFLQHQSATQLQPVSPHTSYHVHPIHSPLRLLPLHSIHHKLCKLANTIWEMPGLQRKGT